MVDRKNLRAAPELRGILTDLAKHFKVMGQLKKKNWKKMNLSLRILELDMLFFK